MDVLQSILNFNLDNSIASLLGIEKQVYHFGKNTANKIVDTIGFNTINIHCNTISGIKDNDNDSDILYTVNLTEPPGFMIVNFPANVLYQNVKTDRIKYIEFSVRDENGDGLCFNLHLV